MNATHEVTNQPAPLEGYDAWSRDPWLREAVARCGALGIEERARELGRFVGSAEGQEHARLANTHVPQLRTHDRRGHRLDAVEYHPSYHALMARAIGAGVHSTAWKRPGGFAARAALFYLWNQLEQGTACPVTMTFASIPIFAHAPELAAQWRPKVLADAYDARPLPMAAKHGVTIGMAMTEKQGGSDLRAVSTAAEPDGDAWRLTGHKWFCSAPMSDAFFTLARRPEGVSCFFVPRSLPDGKRNPFEIQRLKDKVGNRSNASAEIEYRGTWAWPVGAPGRGIATLIEMSHHTRFDIVVGIAGMMRAALDHALHHARHRSAFGKVLAEQPLMQNVLADLALETEAALLVAFRLAAAFDASAASERERDLQRVLTPVAKYWACKRMTPVAAEAMECLGGNGYVEESPLARLFREAPLNGIWEGSANVICLDALRAIDRSPHALDALAAEIESAGEPRATRRLAQARAMLADRAGAERNARAIVESLALAAQASLMARHANGAAAEAFCASRLDAAGCQAFGTLGTTTDAGALVRRASFESE
jgi:putative acyl-CoA dehydrogenase